MINILEEANIELVREGAGLVRVVVTLPEYNRNKRGGDTRLFLRAAQVQEWVSQNRTLNRSTSARWRILSGPDHICNIQDYSRVGEWCLTQRENENETETEVKVERSRKRKNSNK